MVLAQFRKQVASRSLPKSSSTYATPPRYLLKNFTVLSQASSAASLL